MCATKSMTQFTCEYLACLNDDSQAIKDMTKSLDEYLPYVSDYLQALFGVHFSCTHKQRVSFI